MKHAKEKKKSKAGRFLLILLLLALVGGVGYGGWRLLGNLSGGGRGDGLVYEDNAIIGSAGSDQADLEELRRQVDRGMITMCINASPYMNLSNKEAGVNWLIENPEGQSTKLIRVEVTRDDTGEKIYETGALRPGSYITGTPPDVDLAVGEYTCTATFYSYDIDTQAFLGKAASQITLYVLE